MTIGDRIKERREVVNISQTDLAEKAGISKQTLYKYENNIIVNIPSDKVEKIAAILDTTPAYLMGWEKRESIGDRIRTARLIKHISAHEFCQKTGIPVSVLSRYESNVKTDFTIERLNNFAKALGVSVNYLMGTDTINRSLYYPNAEHELLDSLRSLIGSAAVDLLFIYIELDDLGQKKILDYAKKIKDIFDCENNLNAAHARTDKESTPEGQAHDNAIMDDDSEWE